MVDDRQPVIIGRSGRVERVEERGKNERGERNQSATGGGNQGLKYV
jgi:hypothetical protein